MIGWLRDELGSFDVKGGTLITTWHHMQLGIRRISEQHIFASSTASVISTTGHATSHEMGNTMLAFLYQNIYASKGYCTTPSNSSHSFAGKWNKWILDKTMQHHQL